MRITVFRAIAIVVPLLFPVAAVGAPKVGSVISISAAVVVREGKVVPAADNMSLYIGDKVITLPGGSANLRFAEKTVKLGESSVVVADDHRAVLSIRPESSFKDKWKDALQKLAKFEQDHGNHFGHCIGKGHGHHTEDGPGHGHDHFCPPVSP